MDMGWQTPISICVHVMYPISIVSASLPCDTTCLFSVADFLYSLHLTFFILLFLFFSYQHSNSHFHSMPLTLSLNLCRLAPSATSAVYARIPICPVTHDFYFKSLSGHGSRDFVRSQSALCHSTSRPLFIVRLPGPFEPAPAS